MSTDFVPESLAELARFFVAFREEIRNDFAEIKGTLAQTVSRDVYAVEQAALRQQFEAERQALVLRIEALEKDKAATRQRSNQAIVLGLTGLVFPLIVVIVSWVLMSQSAAGR